MLEGGKAQGNNYACQGSHLGGVWDGKSRSIHGIYPAEMAKC